MRLNLSLYNEKEKQLIQKTYTFLKEELNKKLLSPAHMLDHYERVHNLAMKIIKEEDLKVDVLVVGVAALMHDIGEMRSYESKLRHVEESVNIAEKVLKNFGLSANKIKDIIYAISVHSFTKGHIKPETLEAQVLQDADRLDALGAIGIARCLMPSGAWGKQLYHYDDPFANNRKLNDKEYAIDHFYVKLLKLPSLMNTNTAKKMAQERVKILKEFLKELERELVESY